MSKKTKEPPKKRRSGEAQAAWFRNSAGPMKDRREPRKGSKNWRRDHKEE